MNRGASIFLAWALAAFALFPSTIAHAFERTHTCYAANDGRTPVCKKRQKSIPVRWGTGCTTWRTHTDFPDEFLEPLQKSFATWNDVEGSYFQTFYAGSTDQFGAGYDCKSGLEGNENVVSYVEDWPQSLAGRDVVALASIVYSVDTGEILDADIRMNGQHFQWKIVTTVSSDLTVVDVQNVMTHEVGHFLGLEHSSEDNYQGRKRARDATMFANTYPNEIKRRVLDDDDIAGIRAIYPSAHAPDVSCEPPETINHAVLPQGYDPERFLCKSSKGCHVTGSPTSPHGGWIVFAFLLFLSRLYAHRSNASARGRRSE